MGVEPSLINPVNEARATALMAVDFLCPEACRRWARLHLAVAHWHRLDPDNTQGFLARKLGVTSRQLTQARSPPKDPTSPYNGLSEKKHVIAAGIIGVDPHWLVQGYIEDGRDAWPPWTAAATADGRGALSAIFTDFLDDHIAGKPTPAMISTIVYGPHSMAPATDMLDLPDHFGHKGDLTTELRRYLARHPIGVHAYLSRYRPALTACWLALKAEALSRRSPQVTVFGMADERSPTIVRHRWIRQHFAQAR